MDLKRRCRSPLDIMNTRSSAVMPSGQSNWVHLSARIDKYVRSPRRDLK